METGLYCINLHFVHLLRILALRTLLALAALLLAGISIARSQSPLIPLGTFSGAWRSRHPALLVVIRRLGFGLGGRNARMLL